MYVVSLLALNHNGSRVVLFGEGRCEPVEQVSVKCFANDRE